MPQRQYAKSTVVIYYQPVPRTREKKYRGCLRLKGQPRSEVLPLSQYAGASYPGRLVVPPPHTITKGKAKTSIGSAMPEEFIVFLASRHLDRPLHPDLFAGGGKGSSYGRP
ncbi:hypothetical protein JTE90_016235 [Oedothorax gibbosus]|uniref:Uncharacterized protein n=1 Tax=Oedothorax gibbosus TaxID=931172 RepID=A0AAV6VTI0_9ARAC|nr:hypothetical protein JTE90_016235 [Oedothorax gibbosus]